jgi:dienelactone hydrolase
MPSDVVRCPECDTPLSVPASASPRRLRCPSCRATFTPPCNEDEDVEEVEERPRRKRRRKKSNPLLVGLLVGCGALVLFCAGGIGLVAWRVSRAFAPTSFPEQAEDYAEARKTFRTKLLRQGPSPQPGDREAPPPDAREVEYTSGNLKLKAWVNAPPKGAAARKPAVLFLHGGFAFGEEDWDQAEPFREAGFVTMVPILRGENGQPGAYTMFYDEVDDALGAADALARLPYVDGSRLYVSGHSAGGTLALLAAMTSNRFRAAGSFSGSPDQVAFVRGQGELMPFDPKDPREFQMRSPLAYPRSFKCPVRLYYGDEEFGFAGSCKKTAELARKAGLDVQAVEVPGDHFDSVDEAMRRCIVFFKEK